jgi:hypothetical protein
MKETLLTHLFFVGSPRQGTPAHHARPVQAGIIRKVRALRLASRAPLGPGSLFEA